MGNVAGKAGYSCEMAALVSQWRQLWSATAGTTDPAAPFGIVTLASSGSEGASSLAMGAMRQAQTAGFGCAMGMVCTWLYLLVVLLSPFDRFSLPSSRPAVLF